ncbi:MAG: hypothetical protein EBU90_28305 [Proteobacteria bacterium]|nr:hypothetical protein [Pseudomonadota bacterium]
MPTKTEITEFSEMIEVLADQLHLSKMDAIVHHCETVGMEIDLASTLVSPALKAAIREEAQELNLLKKNSKLPI